VRFIVTDFRERYPEATRRSRELGMYRQNYCGCLPSMREAEESRARKREERAKAK
jgi:predicted adenine nucleotide alpha hydrolase (AANH) superfamily ATPase